MGFQARTRLEVVRTVVDCANKRRVTLMITSTTQKYFEQLEQIALEQIAPAAAEIDHSGVFPRASVTVLGQAGLLGLVSSPEVGGVGLGHRAAVKVVERIARDCGSTAMIICRHYCGAAVIEAYGARSIREAIARGEHFSSPIEAENVVIVDEARLGADGQGFDIMMGVVLPYFQLMNAAVSLGISESAIQSTTAHVTGTRYEHLNQTLADSPVNRAHLAKMKIRGDMLRTLLDDSLTALETGRADTMLRVLECKAAAGEIAIEVTDLAMRLCGGAAPRKEVGVERNFRDARASAVMAPTPDMLYEFIGRTLTGQPLFG
jgi:alkylation response protein AidB-like acyl-CoA dehydrogenase